MISKEFGDPLKVYSLASKLQMGTLLDIACTDSNYETMQGRGKGKTKKSLQNNLKRNCGPLEVCS